MEGFTKMVKMQHFKEGGKVNVMNKGGTTKVMCAGGKYKEGGLADAKQDEKTAKKVVKSAFGMHDSQLHDGEKTDLSKLRKGGRAKKEGGNVRKYKAGGAIEMKKDSGDLDKIKKIKDTEPKKAAAPSEAVKRPSARASDVEKEKGKPAGDNDKIKKVPPTGDKKADAESKAKAKPAKKGIDAIDDIDGAAKKFKAGGSIKKMAAGSLTGSLLNPMQREQIAQSMYQPANVGNIPQQQPAPMMQPQSQAMARPQQTGMIPQGMQQPMQQ